MGFVYRVLWFLMSLWIVLSETITILRKLHEVKIFGIPIFLTRVMYIAPFSGHTLFNLNLCLKLIPSYVHKPVVNFLGHPNFFVCKFLKILMVSDKTIHKAFTIHKSSMKQNPLSKFIFSVFTKMILMNGDLNSLPSLKPERNIDLFYVL